MQYFIRKYEKIQQRFYFFIYLPLYVIYFRIERIFKKSKQKKTKYLIFKATGGLTHFLRGLAHCIEYSKNTDHFLIIDCKASASFATEFKNIFYLIDSPYSEDYSCLSAEAKKLLPFNFSQKPAVYINDKTCKVASDPAVFIKINKIQTKKQLTQIYAGSGYSIKRHNRILLRHLRVQDSIKKTILKQQIKKPYIGVHFRNTDMKHDIAKILKKIQAYLLKQEKIELVYIATDDGNSIKKFKQFIIEFNQKTKRKVQCLYQKNIPNPEIGNIHYIPADKLKQKFGLNKIDFHTQVLQDIFLLYRCTFFIPSLKSGLSILVRIMRKKKQCFIVH